MSKKNNLASKPWIDDLEESQNVEQKPHFVDNKPLENIDNLKSIQAKRFQVLSKAGVESSPLQVTLMQSESLRIAQEKIVDLEREIDRLRRTNESLTSSGNVLKEKIDTLMVKLEDSIRHREDEKLGSAEEKDVLLVTLDDAKKEVDRLKEHKKDLENRLSKDLQNIRVRENALENRLELLKLEGSVLKREKDNKIIDLQKKLNKLNDNLQISYSKNKELQNYITQLKDSSSKTVSVLRATILNLEGYQTKKQTETNPDVFEEEEDQDQE